MLKYILKDWVNRFKLGSKVLDWCPNFPSVRPSSDWGGRRAIDKILFWCKCCEFCERRGWHWHWQSVGDGDEEPSIRNTCLLPDTGHWPAPAPETSPDVLPTQTRVKRRKMINKRIFNIRNHFIRKMKTNFQSLFKAPLIAKLYN